MEKAFLLIFWYLFFFKFFTKPYKFSTGEHLENYFNHFIWLGRQLRKGKSIIRDEFYYYYPSQIPFLCTFYPFHTPMAYICSYLSLNGAFLTYTAYLLIHYLFASYMANMAFLAMGFSPLIAFTGAISITYAMRFLNLNQSLAFTPCWMPLVVYGIVTANPFLAGLGLIMMFYAGYTTMMIYLMPVAAILAFQYMSFPQIVYMGITAFIGIFPLFIWTSMYYKRTVRTKTTYEQKAIGSVPIWHFISLFIPMNLNFNGVLYVELTYRVGRIIALAALLGMEWPFGLLGLLSFWMMMGKYLKAPILLRIPAKWSYCLSWCLVLLGMGGLSSLDGDLLLMICLAQLVDVLVTHPSIMFMWPFTEWAEKPSRLFHGRRLVQYLYSHLDQCRVSGLPWPLRTGYINKFRSLGYKGGSCLKAIAKFYNFDSNGSPYHDWFMLRKDDEELDKKGVRFAYSTKELEGKWKPTPIKHLYENENIRLDWKITQPPEKEFA